MRQVTLPLSGGIGMGILRKIVGSFFSVVTVTNAAIEPPTLLAPVTRLATLWGKHTSACSPIRFDGRASYTRLVLEFGGEKYRSTETIYTDPACEISSLETTSQGTWRVNRGTVLQLRLRRMQLRPLDPRIADSLASAKACGKTWENGVSHEILGTACAKGRRAAYFVGRNRQDIDLYECEGRSSPGPTCTHYPMARLSSPKIGRSLWLRDSRRLSKN